LNPAWGIVTALVSAFAAATLTTWFSLWRFQKERWWDKKFESYAAIMESLHNMALRFDAEVEGIGRDAQISADAQQEFQEKYHAGEMEIYKQIAIGEFLLTPKAVESLRKMLRDLDDAKGTNDFSQYIGGSSKAIWDCLERTRSIARSDLGGRSDQFKRWQGRFRSAG
jgi:hypothetical protein